MQKSPSLSEPFGSIWLHLLPLPGMALNGKGPLPVAVRLSPRLTAPHPSNYTTAGTVARILSQRDATAQSYSGIFQVYVCIAHPAV